MCYCKPEIRTPYCQSCAPKMWDDINSLKQQLASVQAELEEAKKWKIPVAEAMFDMTTCVQSGEELAIPDIWDMVCKERDELREEVERYRKALED